MLGNIKDPKGGPSMLNKMERNELAKYVNNDTSWRSFHELDSTQDRKDGFTSVRVPYFGFIDYLSTIEHQAIVAICSFDDDEYQYSIFKTIQDYVDCVINSKDTVVILSDLGFPTVESAYRAAVSDYLLNA